MAKKIKDIKISFVDENASNDVTGSGVYIETPNHKILLDYGLYQSNDKYEDYLQNIIKPKEFKPKDIDLIFVSHLHGDHCLKIPMLYANGCSAGIIMTEGSTNVFNVMAIDSAYISSRDILMINTQHNKKYKPLYEEEDVKNSIKHIKEFPYNTKITIDEEISFELIPSGHLLGSCQIMLYITINGLTKSICYSGDLGNRKVDNKFVGKFEPIDKCNIFIGEATYGDRSDLKVGNKQRNDDLNKLVSIIDTQIKELKGRVLIPTFAQSRSQQLALIIYSLYKDKEWQPTVYIDSPLSIKIFEQYNDILVEEDKILFDEMMKWDKIKFVREPSESINLIASKEPCIILSTAGFCQVGRVRKHLKSLISNPNATVLFVGYSSPNSLASIIKDPKTKTVTIDTKEYKCLCSTYCLKSMSGHMPFDQLVDYYSSINCQKIILHHGSKEAKEHLAKDLKKIMESMCKTTKIVCANSSLKFTI